MPIWQVIFNTSACQRATLQQEGRQKQRAVIHLSFYCNFRNELKPKTKRQREKLLDTCMSIRHDDALLRRGWDISITLNYCRCHTTCLHHPVSKISANTLCNTPPPPPNKEKKYYPEIWKTVTVRYIAFYYFQNFFCLDSIANTYYSDNICLQENVKPTSTGRQVWHTRLMGP